MSITQFFTLSKVDCLLACSLDSKILGTFRAIKLYERCTVTPTETRMLTYTELVKFPYNLLELTPHGSEDDGELSLLFFIVYKGPKE